MNETFFAPCPRGLEAPLADELRELGAHDVAAADAGVSFSGDFALCYRVNLQSRIASRILWSIDTWEYKTEDDVYEGVKGLPWDKCFTVSKTIAVTVNAVKCPLRSLDFITLLIKDAVCDRFRDLCSERPSVETHNPDVRIHAFLNATHVTLYLDTSGEALFKRGLRVSSGDAPLKENLAAGILRMANWKPGIPLVDPMCGSGTFLLQAAQIALDIAPGLNRPFGFANLLNFDEKSYAQIHEELIARCKPVTKLPIYGSDLYGEALDDAKANLQAAGLTDAVQLKQANVLEISPPAESGIMVMNPPYGVRLGEQRDLAEFYPKLGDVLKQKFSGWNAYILSADMRLPKLIHLAASKRTPLFNGKLECRLFEYKMVAGTMRRPVAAE
ncbi:MAG: class I SAM-dependent RNA methyltransferase [Burkholderiales bacterium]